MTATETLTGLSGLMLARADADRLPADHQLRVLATAFDDAARGYFAQPQTVPVKGFVAAWARADVAWHDYLGARPDGGCSMSGYLVLEGREADLDAFLVSDQKRRAGLCPNDCGLMVPTHEGQACEACGFTCNTLPDPAAQH